MRQQLSAGNKRRESMRLGRLTLLANAKIGQLRRQANPLINKFSEPAIILQLLLDLGQFRIADKPSRAFPLPGKAELIVRTVFEWRRGLAAASGVAANIVLLRYCTWAQVTQRGNTLFDCLDLSIQGFRSAEHL